MGGHTKKASSARSKDGYYATHIKHDCMTEDKLGYPEESALPPLLASAVERIRAQGQDGDGTGTAVIIPAFNGFGKSKEHNDGSGDLASIISRSAARNFYPAMLRGELEVEFHDEGTDTHLKWNEHNVQVVFDSGLREQGRSQQRGFLSGRNAASGYDAMRSVNEVEVDVGNGDSVGLHLHVRDTGPTRMDVFRNGMWIADKGHTAFLQGRLHWSKAVSMPFSA